MSISTLLKAVVIALLVWLVLSIPVGVWAGKVLKARREELEAVPRIHRVRPGPPSRPGAPGVMPGVRYERRRRPSSM